MEQIELHWNDILELKELISHENELTGKSGIYVWGWFDEENNFVPYYVGKANNLAQRLFEHLGKLQGGMYSIYSWQYAFSKNFCPIKDQGADLLYTPSNIKNWKAKFHDSTEVSESLNSLLKNVKFSWAFTAKENNRDLERKIACLLNSNSGGKVGASVKGEYRKDLKVKFTGNETLVKMCKENHG